MKRGLRLTAYGALVGLRLRMDSGLRRRCALVSCGDELVLGEKVDTNTTWLAQRLFVMGIEPVERVMLGDDAEALAEALRRLAGRVEVIICTGGLGPTADDLTREGLAAAMRDDLVLDEGALRRIEERLQARGREVSASARVQAMRPSRAVCLDNPAGTAPGLRGRVGEGPGGAEVFCLPGPPHEMRAVFEGSVLPALGDSGASQDGAAATALVHACGIPESVAAERLGDLLARGGRREVQAGITVSSAVVTCRVRAVGSGARERAAATADEAASRLNEGGPFVFGRDEDDLAAVVVRELSARGRMLATAESCTGGMLGEMVTAAAGSSKAYAGGVVSYSNGVKEALLGVKRETLAREGAVSRAVVEEMARGALERVRADHAIAVSGIAGPEGGTAEKPVGTVWIAHAWAGAESGESAGAGEEGGAAEGAGLAAVQGGVCARRVVIPGDREHVRRGSCLIGLALVWFWLKGVAEPPRLVWEVG